ncbi:MAG: dihydropteroate synthase [Rhodospirillaceae bacterium]|nr:dihydropteroate synthase [Rhodospirillaceae bacterium]MDD9913356.1 dihydropteroate synthase [Rhodospirillaceae bacterium]MDD9928158.1 dihydropteroate synthase [Rhodospirillaceae bacterium]
MRLQDRFDWGRQTYVMGILNVTPDSFSGDGVGDVGGETVRRAVDQARAFAAAGADILDIGGESTRPGSQPLTAEAERDRVVPVITAVRAALPDIAVSVDTYRAAVAEAALEAGADMINDVWGLRADPALGPLAAAHGVPVALMHNRSKPGAAVMDARLGGQYDAPDYGDLLADVATDLAALAADAAAAGIDKDQIVLDPGLAFGKTVEQNLQLVDQLGLLKALGYPLLVGPSRKSFIGQVLDLPVEERVEGTAATVAIAIARGADIVRVHDVEAMVRIARMTDAIVRRGD